MENIDNYVNESDTTASEILNFKYSPELEVERIKFTLKKFSWYKENIYKIDLPETIKNRVEKGEKLTDEEILDAVNSEFDENDYKARIEKIKLEWNKIQDQFIKNLTTLGGHVFDKYDLKFTKYGSGGSYTMPNIIVININSDLKIIAHEMIHLSIERLILDNKISHWVKERLVDLAVSKFLPERARFQRDPENKDEIEQIFNSHFPDMSKIIQEVSKLKQE